MLFSIRKHSPCPRVSIEECKMATVGEQLLQPENGWKRYSNMDPNIKYIGNWTTLANDVNFCSNEHHGLESSSGYIQMKFRGTKIRLIDHRYPNRCSTLKAVIDGESLDFSEYGVSQHQTIVFEKIGLDNTIHTVEFIQQPNSTGIFVLDAIDIDANGEILSYTPVVSPTKALLRITMNDSSEREYELSLTEIDDFVTWCKMRCIFSIRLIMWVSSKTEKNICCLKRSLALKLWNLQSRIIAVLPSGKSAFLFIHICFLLCLLYHKVCKSSPPRE